MRTFVRFALPLIVLAAMTGRTVAQGIPTSQPGILTIIMEEVKVGMDAAHEANESGWPAAFAKVNSPYYYMALESMTGSSQVWFISPYESFAAEGENMRQNQSNPALSAELNRLWTADGPYLTSSTTIQALARPDLSHGPFPDLAMVRFYEISLMRIRLGHDRAWENAARVFLTQVERAAPGMSYRIYQVIAGMPEGYYLIFSTANDYSDFDTMMAEGMQMWENVSPEVMETLEGFMTSDVQSVITHRFRVSPTMSYVSEEVKARDPSFWR